jgi:hypothetical protein
MYIYTYLFIYTYIHYIWNELFLYIPVETLHEEKLV